MTQAEKIERFWRWFVGHQVELTQLVDFKAELYPMVIEQVRQVQTGLVVDFEIGQNDDLNSLIVSAEGKVSLFPLVMRVVDRAPLEKIPQWRVVAFRQPRTGQFEIQFPDYRIDTSNTIMQYQWETTRKIILTLKIQDWDEDLPGAWEGVRVMLDNVVGEYNARMKIGQVRASHWELGETLEGKWVPIARLPRIMAKTLGED